MPHCEGGAASTTAPCLSDADRSSLFASMMTAGVCSLATIQTHLLSLMAEAMNADDPQFNKDTKEVFERVMARVMEQPATGQ